MNRTVVTKADVQAAKALAPGARAADGPGPLVPDPYLTRLLKYIPTEVVGAYLAIGAILRSAGPAFPLPHASTWLFGVFLVATPLYLFRVAHVTRPRQLVISTLAFAAWALAMPGPFENLAGQPALGAALVVLFVFGVPIVTG